MTAILRDVCDDESTWVAADLQNDLSWLNVLDRDQRDDVTDAYKHAMAKGCTVASVTKEDFPLPALEPVISGMLDYLENGRGFSAFRGVPIDNLDIEDTELVYAGITAHFGEKLNQDPKGNLIHYVRDTGADYEDISIRGYTTSEPLTPHTDSGDLVVLLCVHPAKHGGLNNISSGRAIHNEILRTHPEYLEPLYNGFHYNIRGSGPTDGDFVNITRHRVPVFSYYESKLSVRFNQKAILTAEGLPGVDPLTDLEKDAINFFSELAMRDDLRFDVMLQKGDIVFLHNHSVIHNRSGFVDHDEPDRKRLLMRQWVNTPNCRPLEPSFADHYNTGPKVGTALHA